ncbi:hypothetical protein ACTXJY_00245 [Corynebacterium casei]|uniref:hypothetical protein n=1 Tax=Corynebacterium casei TaxID=160386 RepID=UPI003FD2A523
MTYPNDVKIVPTEKIKVEPVIGDKPAESAEGEPAEPVVEPGNEAEPVGDSAAVQLAKQAGLTFAIGDIAEGFTAEVDEGGVVTLTAPSGAEVGSTADFTVLVNDTPVALSVTVRSLSEESTEETTGGEEQPNPAPNETVTLDRETYNEMQAAARLGWEAKNTADKQAREAEVDKWIAEGRVNPVRRAKIVDQMHTDPEAARELYGKIPKNTIPLSEVGYSKQNKTVRDTADEKFDARAIAAARRKEGN